LVTTSIYPLAYVIERIAGDTLQVKLLVGPTFDALHDQPSQTITPLIQSSQLVVLNGAGLERYTQWVATHAPKHLIATASLADDLHAFPSVITHDHGKGEHTHEGIDPHTWVDPMLLRAEADAILAALTETFPDHAEVFASNHAALVADLEALDAALRDASSKLTDVPLIAAHPSFNYLAKRYPLKLRNADFDPKTKPGPEALASLGKTLLSHKAKTILWHATPDPEIVDALKRDFQIDSVVFDLVLEAPEGDRDFLSVMKANASTLATLAPAPPDATP